ncbi:DUF3179 domain-containing (seleno)protein [Halobaculum gomorrense]|uniref:DUF3179 domain-containing protein n=1 Tax=Halobaculum gomorrense TaxID=43928 RepID=A0A1M5PJP3_9EURY|nr:DUF3179 domain-containing (seleno)protein [Halobaculum gomorrense]SHH02022.1 Protein of unknown function [Halobaculum gomorrense]
MEIREVLPRDAIPSIDDPTFEASYFGAPGDEAIVVDSDPPRAYPLRILSYHEVVNDAIPRSSDPTDEPNGSAGESDPIAVTWCPICWSALVYDRRVGDDVLTFGVSGNLADDSLVLYDRETESEWQQTSGRCLRGPLEGSTLSLRSSRLTTVGDFRDDHPDGLVLQPVRGGPGEPPERVYDMAPYEGYRSRDAFGLHGMRGEGAPRAWDRSDIDAKTVVIGVEIDGDASAYPRPVVERAGGVLVDSVGGVSVVVFADGDRLSVFEDPGFEFERTDDGVYADGASWSIRTGVADDGRALAPVDSRRMFAFAWQDIHGSDSMHAPESETDQR